MRDFYDKTYDKREEIRDKIEDVLMDMDDDTIIEIYNGYFAPYGGDIHKMEDFDDYCYGLSPTEIADLVKNDNFDLTDEYFINSVDELESSDDIYDWVDLGEIADQSVDDMEDYGNWDIEELLDELTDFLATLEDDDDDEEGGDE